MPRPTHVIGLFQCLSFSASPLQVTWLFRELSAPVLFARAQWSPLIRWRSRQFRLKWGGQAEGLPAEGELEDVVNEEDKEESSEVKLMTSETVNAVAKAAAVTA